MNSLELLRDNLFSPAVLGFLLGLSARLFKSDLRLPEALYQGLSIYLLFAIGLKGGAQLSEQKISTLVLPSLATVLIGLVTPVLAFIAARMWLKTSKADSAALAAHYGSVSAVTFIVGSQFLTDQGLAAESYFPALVAILEIVGILVAVLLARPKGNSKSIFPALKHALTGQGVFLLIGGFLVGWLSGKRGLDPLAPVFIESFTGLLTLFLIQMGILAGERLSSLKGEILRLVIYCCALPLVHGCLGVLIAKAIGMSEGGAFLLGIMSASASYIAAPAAVQSSIPGANPSLYLTASLGISFPFNISLGIPIYFLLARALYH